MSFVLRTHLNAILGMLQLLRGTPLSAEQADYLDTLQESADNLLCYSEAMIGRGE